MKSLGLDAPQLGEHAWHAFTDDRAIDNVSVDHRDRVEAFVRRHLPSLDWRRARLLEVGAYRHYTAHILAANRGCESVVTDIAASSLRDGMASALAQGLHGRTTMVVADFHDLPFSDDHFDVVFVASSVHHTRSPEQVLRDMLRVLKPGGILIVENEPCSRVCCFHAFVSNRQDSFTPFEAALHAAGLLPTISSPFWGARAEQLFGMVENDRIPLSLYMEVFAESGTVQERELNFHALVGPFERELLALTGKGAELHRRTAAVLRSAVAQANAILGERERLLGYRMPTECEIHEVAGRVASLLQRRPRFGNRDEWQAELFGAALTVVVRKRPGTASATDGLFRREMTVEADGLVREREGGKSVASQLGVQLLPDIYATEHARALDEWFPPADWRWISEEHGGISMVNLGERGRVQFEAAPPRTLLVIRYYAVMRDAPYRVRVWAGERLLDDQLVVLQESRLVRASVPTGATEITIETCELDETPVELPWHVRVGFLQLFAAG